VWWLVGWWGWGGSSAQLCSALLRSAQLSSVLWCLLDGWLGAGLGAGLGARGFIERGTSIPVPALHFPLVPYHSPAPPQEVAIFFASQARHDLPLTFPLPPHLPSTSPPSCVQEVANFFVSQARRNFHAPADQADEEDLLIYNYAPSYTGKVGQATNSNVCGVGWHAMPTKHAPFPHSSFALALKLSIYKTMSGWLGG